MLKETKLGKKTRENIGIHRKSMQNLKVVYAKEKLIKASSCRRICVQHIYIYLLHFEKPLNEFE